MFMLPDMKPRQHGCGPATKYPNSEKDDEQRCGEHHLAGVGGCIPDG